ncbi:hypothetical protein GCM10009843_07860 [Nocardioides bigeumensis]|uniref:Uncharacterized protein n=1 Tax=Nocardioides bigeumensis TaxID=433657 RepID=A0ABN2XX96_9ACTN
MHLHALADDGADDGIETGTVAASGEDSDAHAVHSLGSIKRVRTTLARRGRDGYPELYRLTRRSRLTWTRARSQPRDW